MEAIYEFFCRPEVVQFCYGLLAALPPTLASICSIIVVPIVRKICEAHILKLQDKESDLELKMIELADALKNANVNQAEAMTELTKVKREVEAMKHDG